MSMTPEVEKYYETYFDLFSTDGWKQFIQDVSDNLQQYDVRSVENVDDLRFKQGQLKVIDHVMNWEALIRNAYEEIANDASQDL
jgi:hypothetical protein